MASSMFDNNQSICSVFPKSRNELREIIKERYNNATQGKRGAYEVVTVDLNDIDVTNVRSFAALFMGFEYCTFLVDDWKTSNVVSMNNMCNGFCFGLDISNWDTSNVVDFGAAFYESRNIIGLEKLSFKSALYTGRMFENYYGELPAIINWDVKNVLNANRMFFGVKHKIESTFNLNFKNVDNMTEMFAKCNIKSNIDNIKSPDYVNLDSLFYGSTIWFEPKKLIKRTSGKFSCVKIKLK